MPSAELVVGDANWAITGDHRMVWATRHDDEPRDRLYPDEVVMIRGGRGLNGEGRVGCFFLGLDGCCGQALSRRDDGTVLTYHTTPLTPSILNPMHRQDSSKLSEKISWHSERTFDGVQASYSYCVLLAFLPHPTHPAVHSAVQRSVPITAFSSHREQAMCFCVQYYSRY